LRTRQQPSEAIPKKATPLLAVCATLIQFDHPATLVLQHLGKESALRKRRDGCPNIVFSVFHKRLKEGLTLLLPESHMGL